MISSTTQQPRKKVQQPRGPSYEPEPSDSSSDSVTSEIFFVGRPNQTFTVGRPKPATHQPDLFDTDDADWTDDDAFTPGSDTDDDDWNEEDDVSQGSENDDHEAFSHLSEKY